MNSNNDWIGGVCVILFFILCVAAWVTHIFVCLSDAMWGFLIAGAIFFPVAIVHGFGLWFGFF
jgi:hypothetical protein